MNALSVRFNNVFANGEAQPSASFIAAAGGVGAVKAFKNARQVFFFNTNTIITDFHQYMLIIGIINTGYNDAVLLTVFGSVFNQVDQNLFYFFFISKNGDGRFASFFNGSTNIFCLGFY